MKKLGLILLMLSSLVACHSKKEDPKPLQKQTNQHRLEEDEPAFDLNEYLKELEEQKDDNENDDHSGNGHGNVPDYKDPLIPPTTSYPANGIKPDVSYPIF